MAYRRLPVVAVMLASCTAPSRPPAAPVKSGDDTLEAHVNSCHDGDTCRIRLTGGVELNVRLAGVDAPEVARRSPGQPLGEAARDFVNDLVRGRSVRLRQIDLDRYNRPVVEMWQAGETARPPVNVRLVRAGLAEVYRRAPPPLALAPYLAAEAEAKAARRGVWGLGTYQSPAAFRQVWSRARPTKR